MRTLATTIGLLSILGLISACNYQQEAPYRPSYGTLRGAAIGGGIGIGVGAIAGSSVGAMATLPIAGVIVGAAIGSMNDSATAIKHKLTQNKVQVVDVGDQTKLILDSDLLFTAGSAKLTDSANAQLTLVTALLNKYDSPTMVRAFTDKVAGPVQNIPLSTAQAKTILAYLWSRGIPIERLKSQGYGSTPTIASDRTITGSAYNRRIEITWLRS